MEQWEKERAPISKSDLIACIRATEDCWRNIDDVIEQIREQKFNCIAVSTAIVNDMEVSAESDIDAKHRALHCGHAIQKAVELLLGTGHQRTESLPSSIRIDNK